MDKPWDAIPINQQTATEAFVSVLKNAGATLPLRDAVDTRVVNDVRRGTATHEGSYKAKKRVAEKSEVTGIIDSQKDVGGWPTLRSTPAPKDTDRDGMPDKWETMHGLDPNDVDDGNRVAEGGYTMLETYLNSIE